MADLNRREFLNAASALAATGLAAGLASRVYAAGDDEPKKDRPPVRLA